MSTRYAFVTLLTSDAYLPGALIIPAALKEVHQHLPPDQTLKYETVCLVTPETVDVSAIRLLRKAFDVVIGVEVIAPPDSDSLTLLGRPDLDTALTKLHVFRLTQYSKVIFLDADVLPLRPLSHLFHLDHEFSAVPDVGWPDIFNSGVMVLSPGEDKFEELQELLNTKGTWDGADQGLLNEWRGSNWNRLSFTYNTTPTAAYTYAPAYHRFGSQISVVHFIGPHKPWHSIPYRAPGSSTQPTHMDVESSSETPAAQRAYDYGSLVDRWYNVYDQYYRSQVAKPVFQPNKYTSAWNEEGLRHPTLAGGVLGLEELRHAALEGMVAAGIPAPRAHGEGEYRILPIEGRFDLIRPRTRAERKEEASTETSESIQLSPESPTTSPEPSTPPGQILYLPSDSPVRWTTLPTPGINELPPAPHARPLSLPPTPLRYVPSPYKPLRKTREVGAQTISIQLRYQDSGKQDLPPTPLIWDSAIHTPPSVVTPALTDTYFSHVWDVNQNSPDTSSTTMGPSPSAPQPIPSASFSPSFPPTTPEMLHRQDQYHQIMGEENGSPAPDPTKVKRIFPWEERPRHAPGRVFPEDGTLLASLPHFPISATPEKKHAFRSPMPSPLVDFPPSFQPYHASESPLPQKHVGKAALYVPSPSPLGLRGELSKTETSSQDGDVEDEVDTEEDTVVRPRRIRSHSMGMPAHRSVGVQTDPRELREEGVQVTSFVPASEVAEKLILMNRRSRRKWSMPIGTTRFSAISPPRSASTSTLSPDSRDHSVASDDADEPNPFYIPSLPNISSTADDSPSHIRKGSRVWDPARGVETFKQKSEEVLARFMKIGSWEERA